MTERIYTLVIEGELGDTAVRAFDRMAVSQDHGNTVLVAPVSDQGQLYALLRRVFELGLTVRSVIPTEDDQG
jgi:hypothetical protein